MKVVTETCVHFDEASIFETNVRVCQECVDVGSGWVHLRLCLNCGYVGCCDSSPNKHTTAHTRAAQHPVIRSIEPGESWGYCYDDQLFVDTLDPR